MTLPSARSRGPTSTRTGTPLSSQSTLRRPKLVSVRSSRRTRWPAARSSAEMRVGRRPHLGVVLDDHHDHLRRRQRRAAGAGRSRRRAPSRARPTSRVETPHDVCHTYSVVPDAFEKVMSKGRGEVLAELVAGSHLQRLAVAHHPFARPRPVGAGKALARRLVAREHRDAQARRPWSSGRRHRGCAARSGGRRPRWRARCGPPARGTRWCAGRGGGGAPSARRWPTG